MFASKTSFPKVMCIGSLPFLMNNTTARYNYRQSKFAADQLATHAFFSTPMPSYHQRHIQGVLRVLEHPPEVVHANID